MYRGSNLYTHYDSVSIFIDIQWFQWCMWYVRMLWNGTLMLTDGCELETGLNWTCLYMSQCIYDFYNILTIYFHYQFMYRGSILYTHYDSVWVLIDV